MKTPVWVVEAAEPHRDYTISLTFAGGEKRVYDARPLLEQKPFQPLKNLGLFMTAEAKHGTVVWSDDLDIAPEHLYECSVPEPDRHQ